MGLWVGGLAWALEALGLCLPSLLASCGLVSSRWSDLCRFRFVTLCLASSSFDCPPGVGHAVSLRVCLSLPLVGRLGRLGISVPLVPRPSVFVVSLVCCWLLLSVLRAFSWSLARLVNTVP